MRTTAIKFCAPVLGLLVSTEVLAFKEVSHPWSSTPSRLVRTAPDFAHAKAIPAISALGMHTVSFRSDGSPALIWATQTRAAQKISKTTAEERALEVARSIASDLGVDARDLALQGSVAFDDDWTSVTVAQKFRGMMSIAESWCSRSSAVISPRSVTTS